MNAEENRLFEQLMTWREDVFRICLGFSRNSSDAEDLSQDVYLKALRNIGTIHDPGAARGWLLRIARNTGLDHRKRARLFQLFRGRAAAGPPQKVAPPEARDDPPERPARLKEAIDRLGRKHKEVLILREYGELTYEEIAGALGLKMGTVMSRLSRARRSVAAFMKEGAHG